jgi:hypothetical protein
MTQHLDQLWLWMHQTFGMLGVLCIVFFVLLLCFAWFITPIGVWLLYRQGRLLERHLAELRDRTASLSRQQQVERIKRDRVRRKPGRRR